MKNLAWLSCDTAWQSPVFRRSFELEEVPRGAKIKICGLGFFELFINGARVSEDYFKPAWSDYERRDLSSLIYPMPDASFTHRVYYMVYEVGRYLRAGKNVIAVMLGNGWYRQTMRNIEGKLAYNERLKLAFALTVKLGAGKNRVISSDTKTKCKEGYIVQNNIYYGETHDYSQAEPYFETEYDDADWTQAALTLPPNAVFSRQECPSDRVMRTLAPKLLFDHGERKIYDAGENISGWAALEGRGTVTVRYAEELRDGELDFASAGGEGQIQADTYLALRAGRHAHPIFCWHAFRYFEVCGEVTDIRVDVVHADVRQIREFKTDNEDINWLLSAFVRTQLSNMHAGVPSDCPHRERLGYTGDGQVACDAAMTLLDCKKFYKKWIRDILDCQDRETGHVRHTAPFYGGGGGPGGWGGAVVIVPYTYYKHYGDTRLLSRCYPHILRWLEFMRGCSQDGLIVREIEGGWCLGDWCTPEDTVLPEPFVNTYYYIKCMRYAEEIAAELGKPPRFQTEIKRSLDAVKAAYYDPETHSFCNAVQGADAFGLALGLGGERTLANLVNKYQRAECLDTGLFGTDVLFGVLTDNGQTELILRLLSHKKQPSFGYMRARGATTLWETWDGNASHNHPMLGACVRHILRAL